MMSDQGPLNPGSWVRDKHSSPHDPGSPGAGAKNNIKNVHVNLIPSGHALSYTSLTSLQTYH